MPATLTSRLPAIAAELKPRMDVALRAAAEAIAEDAKQRVPVDTGKLRTAIHVERRGMADYQVVAGDTEAWYGHLVEFGTKSRAPRPFVVPAVEAQRDRVEHEARAVLAGL